MREVKEREKGNFKRVLLAVTYILPLEYLRNASRELKFIGTDFVLLDFTY